MCLKMQIFKKERGEKPVSSVDSKLLYGNLCLYNREEAAHPNSP